MAAPVPVYSNITNAAAAPAAMRKAASLLRTTGTAAFVVAEWVAEEVITDATVVSEEVTEALEVSVAAEAADVLDAAAVAVFAQEAAVGRFVTPAPLQICSANLIVSMFQESKQARKEKGYQQGVTNSMGIVRARANLNVVLGRENTEYRSTVFFFPLGKTRSGKESLRTFLVTGRAFVGNAAGNVCKEGSSRADAFDIHHVARGWDRVSGAGLLLFFYRVSGHVRTEAHPFIIRGKMYSTSWKLTQVLRSGRTQCGRKREEEVEGLHCGQVGWIGQGLFGKKQTKSWIIELTDGLEDENEEDPRSTGSKDKIHRE